MAKDLWRYVESSDENQTGEKSDKTKISMGRNQARAIIICNVETSIVPLMMAKEDPKEIGAP